MYIDVIPNRKSPPAVLLRESYREDGKIKKRTLANLSMLPLEVVEGLRVLLKGGTAIEGGLGEAFEVVRSLPHGHVAAVLGTIYKLGLHKLLSKKGSRHRQAVLAMIAARVLFPGSKLATCRGLRHESQNSSLGELLGLRAVDEDELYAAMDWLVSKQERVETELAGRHLEGGVLVLYDLTSVYMEGRHCELARHGYSRDGKKGKLQIEFGLLCDSEGRPIAVEVFEGNAADPSTVATQVEKVRERFGLEHVVFVGDRAMLTSARIEEDLKPVGLDWISSLRSPHIRSLVDSGALQLSLFDEKDIAEISHPDFPGERLVACGNPLLAAERTRKRQALLATTEADLEKIRKATQRARRPRKGEAEIGVRGGRVLERSKVGKHFVLEIGEDTFEYHRDEERIAAEAGLDGLYVVRTSVPGSALTSEQAVEAYKSLARVERAFRCMKTVDLKVQPIHHRKADRVRAHVLICMLAYYVEWHMRRDLASILFDDDDVEAARRARTTVVEPARRSEAAHRKARSKRTEDGLPVHSFRTLLDDLATLTLSTIRPELPHAEAFNKLATPTQLQQRAIDLLGIRLTM